MRQPAGSVSLTVILINMKTILVLMLFCTACIPCVTPSPSQSLNHITDGNYFKVAIHQDSLTSEHSDECLIEYIAKSSLMYVPGEDAPVSNAGYVHLESLAKASDGNYYTMAINVMPFVKDYILSFNIGCRQSGSYMINVDQQLMPKDARIELTDKFARITMNLSPKKAVYNFTVNLADTATYGNHRFTIEVK